jgi:hypothetical protein
MCNYGCHASVKLGVLLEYMKLSCGGAGGFNGVETEGGFGEGEEVSNVYFSFPSEELSVN